MVIYGCTIRKIRIVVNQPAARCGFLESLAEYSWRRHFDSNVSIWGNCARNQMETAAGHCGIAVVCNKYMSSFSCRTAASEDGTLIDCIGTPMGKTEIQHAYTGLKNRFAPTSGPSRTTRQEHKMARIHFDDSPRTRRVTASQAALAEAVIAVTRACSFDGGVAVVQILTAIQVNAMRAAPVDHHYFGRHPALPARRQSPIHPAHVVHGREGRASAACAN